MWMQLTLSRGVGGGDDMYCIQIIINTSSHGRARAIR